MSNPKARKATSTFLLAAMSAATLSLWGAPALATASDDALIEGAKLCTRYLPRQERQYGIPVHLLAAIASTESGRFHRALGLNLPWPWTINVEGKGYFFETKEEAIAAVQKFQSRGYQSIDVGCMQVNLRHHPGAFASLEQAFDPAYNIAYAAQFLKRNFEDGGTWRNATGYYHSRTARFGDPYANMVFGAWSRIINKVADARAGRPVTNNYASTRNAPPIRYHDQAAVDAAAAVGSKLRAGYKPVRMNSISMARDSSRERGVLVIRPGASLTAKVNEAAEEFVTQQKKKGSSAMEQKIASLEKMSYDKPAASAAPAPAEKSAQIVKVNAGQFQGSRSKSASDYSVAKNKSAFIFEN